MKFCLLNKHFIKRLTALYLISILLLQQPCWAVGYGAVVLVPYQPISSLNHADFNRNLAQSIYRFLKPLLKQGLNKVELKPGVFVDVSGGMPFSSIQDLERLSAWLKDPQTHTVPCSAYVLYNLIRHNAAHGVAQNGFRESIADQVPGGDAVTELKKLAIKKRRAVFYGIIHGV